MALNDLISVSFIDEELLRIDEALLAIENILKDKVVNLMPKQRLQYGRVACDMNYAPERTFMSKKKISWLPI